MRALRDIQPPLARWNGLTDCGSELLLADDRLGRLALGLTATRLERDRSECFGAFNTEIRL